MEFVKNFFDYIKENPVWGVVIAALFVMMIVMFILAGRAGRKRQEERDRIIAQLEKEKALRKEYKTLTPESFDADNEKLLFGIAANIQQSLEKESDMTTAFNEMPEYKQYIYALNYVFEDSGFEQLSTFFRCNGQPLTGAALKAVSNVIGEKLYEIFEPMYMMFDDDNEEVSYNEEKILKLDEQFKLLMETDKDSVLDKIADFIKSHKDELIK